MFSLSRCSQGLSADTTLNLPNSLLLLREVDADAVGMNAQESNDLAEAAARSVVGDNETEIAACRNAVLPYVAGSERAVISRGGVAEARAHRTALECTVRPTGSSPCPDFDHCCDDTEKRR